MLEQRRGGQDQHDVKGLRRSRAVSAIPLTVTMTNSIALLQTLPAFRAAAILPRGSSPARGRRGLQT